MPPRPIAFALPEKPLSYNAVRDATRKAAYAARLRTAFQASGGTLGAIEPPQYGLVYHLHRRVDVTDVDNISKLVWDALEGLAYEDDATVRLRIAGKIRIGRSLPPGMDATRAPPAAFRRLISLTGKQNHDHVLYIELGTLTDAMFMFGLGA